MAKQKQNETNKMKTKLETYKQEKKAYDRDDLIFGDLMTSENKLFPFSPMVLSFYPDPLGAQLLVQQLSVPLSLFCNVPVCSLDTSGSLEWLPHARCLTIPPPLSPQSDLVLGYSLGGRKRNAKVKVFVNFVGKVR